MQENTNNIKNLLHNVAIIQKKYDEIAQITGENFNIFSVMKMEKDEVYTHSAIIGELLNPKGSHGQGDVYLRIFVSEIKRIFNSEIELDHFNTLVNDNICERIITISNDWEEVSGGRIDIVIEDNNQILIIENKPGIQDQPYQLIRYNNYAKTKSPKKVILLYLTLNGRNLKKEEEPFEIKNIKIEGYNFKHNEILEYGKFREEIVINNINIHHCIYYPISFEIHIRDWIEKCLQNTYSLPIIRETLVQYLHLIKKITNQSTNNKMSTEIIKTILSSKENIKSSIEINKLKVEQIICDELFNRIQAKIGNKLFTENYDADRLYGQEESGMWFSEKEDFKIGVLLWFSTNYELRLGIDVKTNNSEEKISIREKNGSNTNWVKEIPFDEFRGYFKDCEWEEVLDDKNITGIVEKINQLIEEIDSLITV